MSIRVYIITDIGKERSNLISRTLFSDQKFEVIIPDFNYLPSNTPGLEIKKVLNILINSKNEAPKKQVLIIKDSSTATSSETILKTLNKVTESDYDLFYLCRWLDKCEKNQKIESSGLVSIETTSRPQGIQAILFSRKGRDKVIEILKAEGDGKDTEGGDEKDLNTILLDKISKKKLEAICSNPNIIEYDISLSKNKNQESYKTMTCDIKGDEKREDKSDTKSGTKSDTKSDTKSGDMPKMISKEKFGKEKSEKEVKGEKESLITKSFLLDLKSMSQDSMSIIITGVIIGILLIAIFRK